MDCVTDGSAPAAVTDRGAIERFGWLKDSTMSQLSQDDYRDLMHLLDRIEQRCILAQHSPDPRAVARDIKRDVAEIKETLTYTEVPA